MEDEDSLLEKINDVEDLEDEELIEASQTNSKREDADINAELDYSEDDEEVDEKHSDGEVTEKEDEGECKSYYNDKKKDEELEDGEIEDSDEDEKKNEIISEGEISDDDVLENKSKLENFRSFSPKRQPIEVGSNNSRLSRPVQSRSIIRGIPPQGRSRNSSSTVEFSWEQGLLETKRLLEKASARRQEDPEFEKKRLLAAPTGEREYRRRDVLNEEIKDRSRSPYDDDPKRGNIPSLMEVVTRTPLIRSRKDLGPQCIYPTRNQRETKILNKPKVNVSVIRSNIVKPEKVESIRENKKSPQEISGKGSTSPVARGISFSPTRDASPISSDSDEELLLKRKRKESSSSSSSLSSSSISSKIKEKRRKISSGSRSSATSNNSNKKSRDRKKSKGLDYKDPWARNLKNINESKNEKITIASSPDRSRPRRRSHARSSSSTPSPNRALLFGNRNRHMKRVRPIKLSRSPLPNSRTRSPPTRSRSRSPIPRSRIRSSPTRSRTRSPPPYPPGMKPHEKDRNRSQSPQSPPCGDITSYRIPKRPSSKVEKFISDERKLKYQKNRTKDEETGSLFPKISKEANNRHRDSINGKKQKNKEKLKDTLIDYAIETISDSSDAEKMSNNERKKTTRSSSSTSFSSSSSSRSRNPRESKSSSSCSSRSNSPALPAKYRDRQDEHMNVERNLNVKDKSRVSGASSPSASPSPPPFKCGKREGSLPAKEEKKSPVPPPPAPSQFDDIELKRKKEEKRRKKQELLEQLRGIESKLTAPTSS